MRIIVNKNFLIQFVLLIFAYNVSYTQDIKNTQIVKEEMFYSELNSKNSNSTESNHVKSLLYNLQESVYINDASIKTYGSNPKNLYSNLKNINFIDDVQINKKNIEIIIIKINEASELNTRLDMSKFSNYTNLKYLYIVSTVQLNEQTLKPIFNSSLSSYKVLYRYDSGDLQ